MSSLLLKLLPYIFRGLHVDFYYILAYFYFLFGIYFAAHGLQFLLNPVTFDCQICQKCTIQNPLLR